MNLQKEVEILEQQHIKRGGPGGPFRPHGTDFSAAPDFFFFEQPHEIAAKNGH